MLSKQNPKITFVIYQDQKISRAFEFEKKKLRLIIILTPTLILGGLFCSILLLSLNYRKARIKKQDDTFFTHKGVGAMGERKKLESELEKANTLNKKYKETIIAMEKRESQLIPLFHVPKEYEDFTDQKLLKVTNINIKFRHQKIYFDFDIINEKRDRTKLEGHILIAMLTPSQIFLYPPAKTPFTEGAIASFDQGETFTISRFRRVQASFSTSLPFNSSASFRIYIFSNTGNIIYNETIGPMNVEPTP